MRVRVKLARTTKGITSPENTVELDDGDQDLSDEEFEARNERMLQRARESAQDLYKALCDDYPLP